MKQHITSEDLAQLTPEGRQKYDNLIFAQQDYGFSDRYGDEWHNLLTIGQMIEFLGDDYIDSMVEFCDGYWETLKGEGSIKKPDDICDSLWEAVKETLNK